MTDGKEQKRSAYREEMDAVHLSDAKAEETLRLMLEKNRAIRERETARRSSLRLRRLIPAFAAAAACIVLAVVLLSGNGSPASFGSVRLSELSHSGYRGESSEAGSFEEIFGTTPAALFPGWTVESETVSAARQEARLTLRRDGILLSAATAKAEPPLHKALSEAGVEAADGIRYNRDPSDGSLQAVCVLGPCYVTFSSAGLSEDAFVAAVRSVTAP